MLLLIFLYHHPLVSNAELIIGVPTWLEHVSSACLYVTTYAIFQLLSEKKLQQFNFCCVVRKQINEQSCVIISKYLMNAKNSAK